MKKHNNHLYQVIKIEHFLSVMPVYPTLLKLEVPHVDQEATDQDVASLRRSLNDRDVVCNADLHVFNHEVDNG